MDPILALALLFFGAFVGVCIAGLIYVATVRPEIEQPPLISDEQVVILPIAASSSGGALSSEGQTSTTLAPVLQALQDIDARLSSQKQQLEAMSNQLAAEIQAQAQTLRTLSQQIDLQTSLLAHANTLIEDLEQAQTTSEALLQTVARQMNEMEADVEWIKTKKMTRHAIRLSDIKGIGPVYAGKLYEAGIENYQQLAALTPEELRQILRAEDWQIDEEGWIAQARALAEQQAKLEANLE